MQKNQHKLTKNATNKKKKYEKRVKKEYNNKIQCLLL